MAQVGHRVVACQEDTQSLSMRVPDNKLSWGTRDKLDTNGGTDDPDEYVQVYCGGVESILAGRDAVIR
jgi:hypothetical protein